MMETLVKNERDSVHEEVFEERKNRCKTFGICLLGTGMTIGIILGSWYAGVYYQQYLMDGSDLN